MLLILTMVVFLIQSVLPADPVRAAVGGQATQEVVDAKRQSSATTSRSRSST